MVHQGLPVAGYAPTQSGDAVALVNEGKELEERVRRYLDKISGRRHHEPRDDTKTHDRDTWHNTAKDGTETTLVIDHNPRLLAMARSEIEKGFMLAFKSVFQPGDGRISLPEDAPSGPKMIEIGDDGRIKRIITDPLQIGESFQLGGLRLVVVNDPDVEAQTVDGVPITEIVAKNGLPPRCSLY